jgi:hypothetical protein
VQENGRTIPNQPASGLTTAGTTFLLRASVAQHFYVQGEVVTMVSSLPPAWVWLSAFAFLSASVWLIVSFCVFRSILNRLNPVFDELTASVAELGNTASHAVSRASLTMDMVEQRVGQAMSQANTGSAVASRQSIGIGTVLTGLYLATRVAGMLRGKAKTKKKRRR